MRHKGRAVCNHTGGLQLASVIRQSCRRTGPGEESTLKTQRHGKTQTHTRTDSSEQAVHCCSTNPTLSTSTTAVILPGGSARSCSLISVLYVEVVSVLWRETVVRLQSESLFKCWIIQTVQRKTYPLTYLQGRQAMTIVLVLFVQDLRCLSLRFMAPLFNAVQVNGFCSWCSQH